MEKTPEQLNAEFVDPALVQNINSQRSRAREYPAVTDQLDMLWHMMEDEVIPGKGSEWFNAIQSVKQKYPKQS
jgi:hypothetical protein